LGPLLPRPVAFEIGADSVPQAWLQVADGSFCLASAGTGATWSASDALHGWDKFTLDARGERAFFRIQPMNDGSTSLQWWVGTESATIAWGLPARPAYVPTHAITKVLSERVAPFALALERNTGLSVVWPEDGSFRE